MYKLLLILKYLRRRRIAWVSLAAVMLCTAMVLVVISIMGGWLDMFEAKARGLTGDIVIRKTGMAGFPYYEQMIAEMEKLPEVAAAVPTIETYGVISINNPENKALDTDAVKVIGYPADKVGLVNVWPQSLYRQHTSLVDELARKDLTPERRRELEEKLKQPPSFEVYNEAEAPLRSVPDGVPYDAKTGRVGPVGDPLFDRLAYDRDEGYLTLRGTVTDEER